MRALRVLLQRQVALGLVMCMVVPFGAAETNIGFQTPQPTEIVRANSMEPAIRETAGNRDGAVGPIENSDKPTSLSTTPSQQTPNSPPLPAQQNTPSPAPAGTAAAPYEKQEGVSASNPAGSAIAPGKQRRIRSFAIRVGLLVGAAVAIGVVAGASLGSSSRP